jgi:hypothetical protein
MLLDIPMPLGLDGGGDTDGGDGDSGEGDGDGTDGGGDAGEPDEADVADDGNGLGRLSAANANANAFANANGNSVVGQIVAALSETANVELTDEIIYEIIALLQLEFAATDDEGDGTGDDEGDGENDVEDDMTFNEFGSDIVPF